MPGAAPRGNRKSAVSLGFPWALGGRAVPFRIGQSAILARADEVERAMADKYWEHRAAWDLYRLPEAAQSAFRKCVRDARNGEAACEVTEAFIEAGVLDLLKPVVVLHDAVVDGLAELPADERPAIEQALFSQVVGRVSATGLVRQVLDRARRDGLNDRQLAGALTVVLESHGLLQRDRA